jgi:tetratricopeptide (TPR) repeat protein
MGDLAGLVELQRSIELEPLDRFDRWSRGAAQMYLLRYSAAAKTFAEIAEEDPGDADAWFHLALARLRSGDIHGAVDALAKSRRIRPFDGWIDWLDAEIYHARGMDEEALQVLEEATTRFSSSAGLALRIGALWDRLGDPVRGRDWIRRADAQRMTAPRREWRAGGRFVEQGRDHLMLGPPAPPE